MPRASQTLTLELDFGRDHRELCAELNQAVPNAESFFIHDVIRIGRDGKPTLIGRKRLFGEATKLLHTSARLVLSAHEDLEMTSRANHTFGSVIAEDTASEGPAKARWVVRPVALVQRDRDIVRAVSGTAGRIPPGRSLAQNWASLRQRSTGFSVSRSLVYGRWPLTEELRTKVGTARYSPKMDEFVRKDVSVLPAYIFTDEDNTVLGFFDLGLHTSARPRKPNGAAPDSTQPTPAHRGVKNPEKRVLLTQCAVQAYENEMIAAGATRVYYCETRMNGFTASGWMHPMNVPARYKAWGVRRLEHRGEGEVAEALEKLNVLRQMGYYALLENVPRVASGYSNNTLNPVMASKEQIPELPFNVLVTDPDELLVVCPVEDMEAV